MHESDVIEIIEPTPRPKSRFCRILVLIITAALTGTPYATALLIGYRFDFFFAAAAFLLTYLVTGIVRAKIRNDAVPPFQQEYHYSDRAIAAWFVDRRLLCGYSPTEEQE